MQYNSIIICRNKQCLFSLFALYVSNSLWKAIWTSLHCIGAGHSRLQPYENHMIMFFLMSHWVLYPHIVYLWMFSLPPSLPISTIFRLPHTLLHHFLTRAVLVSLSYLCNCNRPSLETILTTVRLEFYADQGLAGILWIILDTLPQERKIHIRAFLWCYLNKEEFSIFLPTSLQLLHFF